MGENIERIRIFRMLVVAVYFVETDGWAIDREAAEGSKKSFVAGHGFLVLGKVVVGEQGRGQRAEGKN